MASRSHLAPNVCFRVSLIRRLALMSRPRAPPDFDPTGDDGDGGDEPLMLRAQVRPQGLEALQKAFDEATMAYKTCIGNRRAWSKFHDTLMQILDRSTGLLHWDPSHLKIYWLEPELSIHEALEEQLERIINDLLDLAGHPELAVHPSALSGG